MVTNKILQVATYFKILILVKAVHKAYKRSKIQPSSLVVAAKAILDNLCLRKVLARSATTKLNFFKNCQELFHSQDLRLSLSKVINGFDAFYSFGTVNLSFLQGRFQQVISTCSTILKHACCQQSQAGVLPGNSFFFKKFFLRLYLN